MCQRVKGTVKCVAIVMVMIYVKSAGAGETETALVVREGRARFLLCREKTALGPRDDISGGLHNLGSPWAVGSDVKITKGSSLQSSEDDERCPETHGLSSLVSRGSSYSVGN
jgi:hypothetical protein